MADPGVSSTLLQQLASQYQTPATIPAVQHSQYLAQALANLQDSAKNNIKTPTALWSSLLADGLLQYARHKSDAQLVGAIQSGQQAQQSTADSLMGIPTGAPPPAPATPPAATGLGGMLAHILGHGAPPPAPTAPPSAPQANPAPVPAPLPPALQSAPAPQASALMPDPNAPRGLRNNNPLNVTTLPNGQWNGQVGADGPYAQFASMQDGWNAADKNLTAYGMHHGINTVDGVIRRWAPDAPPAYVASVSAKLGIDPHQPIDLSQPGIRQGVLQAMAPFEQGRPVAPPGQAAPSPGGGMAPPAAVSPPAVGGMPTSAATQPPPVQGVPTGLGATPQEVALYKQYMSNPLTRQAGLELAAKIAQRHAAPVELNKDEFFTPDGQAHSVHQLQDVQSSAPNSYVQRDPVTGELKITANPAYGPVGAGQVMGQGGQISQVPTTQRQTFRIPGSPGVYVTGPDGTPQKVADDNYTVKDAGQALQELTASPQYEKAAKLTNMYRGIVTASSRPGGMTDAELKDNAAQIFSGGVARQFNAKMIDEGQGPILRLKQFAGEIMSGQKLSPEARQAIIKAANDYTTEAQREFQGLAKSKSDFASAHGQDISPFLGPLLQSIPSVPDISTIPTGSGGYDTSTTGPKPPSNGLPIINGKPLDPNSEAGKLAQKFMARGLHYDQASGEWR